MCWQQWYEYEQIMKKLNLSSIPLFLLDFCDIFHYFLILFYFRLWKLLKQIENIFIWTLLSKEMQRRFLGCSLTVPRELTIRYISVLERGNTLCLSGELCIKLDFVNWIYIYNFNDLECVLIVKSDFLFRKRLQTNH